MNLKTKRNGSMYQIYETCFNVLFQLSSDRHRMKSERKTDSTDALTSLGLMVPSIYIKSRNSELGMTSQSSYRLEKNRMDACIIVASVRVPHIRW